ncbi:Gfo/Idh/MocA family oxidoreductase [Stieleria sp. ICT_E10.1]|uniref:Gfo/Idh/MocA family protein n=1 Tax=Stieleria sedimenti TaxID=2976331 RepID=UPI0021805EF5|nr:Gfo/Idh/MocA family oxidoreductase [Stieleria sedimenti]MCS7469595.1 Gfo/Idh/MocA family oxidoreductase [Stieleria sedimenti]
MNLSPQNHASRRTALKSIGATTALAASGVLPSTTYAAPSTSASDKLRVGLIGAGGRAKWLTRALSRESHRAELVAVSDCYLPQIDALAADNEKDPKAGDSWRRYQNYEQMFEQEDLDAVMIATPDHVRVRAAIIACAKGLDVYAEKPLSFSIPEGRALVKAVRKHERILQVGTQQRSTPINQYACEFIRDGGLGKVATILVKKYSGSRPVTGLARQPVPEGMDWNRFCDQATLLDYHEQLHRRWRNFDTFTGGPICDRGSHALDMVHLAMGWENVAPTRIEPTTEAENDRDRGVRLYYPDGTVIRLESTDGPAFGGIFIGERGKVEINRGRFACNPKDLLQPFTGSQTESHVGNWLDCIETREQPNAPVEVGHLITSVAHLINICRTTGRTINWDATKEQIIGDDAANALLTKERRPEFSLPTV